MSDFKAPGDIPRVWFGSVAWQPVGHVWVAAGEKGVVRVSLGGDEESFRSLFEGTGAVLAESMSRGAGRCEEALEQLQEYFVGERRYFSLALDTGVTSRFASRVIAELREVAFGELLTYGELAKRCGRPRAARAVGRVMAANPVPVFIPCHRVVAKSGPGGFGPGLMVKSALLRLEGRRLPG